MTASLVFQFIPYLPLCGIHERAGHNLHPSTLRIIPLGARSSTLDGHHVSIPFRKNARCCVPLSAETFVPYASSLNVRTSDIVHTNRRKEASILAKDSPIPTCSNPKGISASLESTIYWNRRTGAHIVMGDIRELYLKLSGPKGKLGYPVEDETYSPDHYGRISRFERGQIAWHPSKGARVSYKERDHDDDERDDRRDE